MSESVEAKRWLPLETNPELINTYIHRLGASDKFEFVEIFGVDDDLLSMVPQPVYAVLLAYPLNLVQEDFRRTEDTRLKADGQIVSENLFFVDQIVGNACGTIGAIHCILNNPSIELGEGKFFSSFLNETKGMTAVERGRALNANTDIEEQHSATASSDQAQTVATEHADTNVHFIAFVLVDGHIYELDGRKSFPINYGPSTRETFMHDTANIIRGFMNRDPNEIRFNMLALCDKQE